MKRLILTAAVLLAATAAHAAPKPAKSTSSSAAVAPPKYIYGQTTLPIAAGVIVPAGSDTFYLSGVPGTPATGNTEAQTTEVLGKLGAVLSANGYGFADVVNVKVYLVGDPKLDGKLDFTGMNTAFKKAFGTEGEPNKPSRVTVQVAALAAPGSLVEIEMTAAKPPAH